MRILIVHYNFESPERAGGAESAIRDQRDALLGLGHEVETEFDHPEEAYETFKPDVVHFHTVHVQLGINVLRWAQRGGIPHCLSLHDYWPFCADRMLMKHGAQRMGRRDESCSAVTGLCNSGCASGPQPEMLRQIVNGTPTVTFNPYSAAIFRRHGIRVDAVIPHGIDTALFSPDYTKRDGVAIATTSAWPRFPTKGMHVLKAALTEIGERATLIHGVPRERVAEELKKASIHVFPSCYEETWGLCLTEAMASGCACIASGVCGPRAQIEHGVNGLLFPNRDSHALAEHIGMLLNEPGTRDRLGRAARVWAVANCTLECMGREYEEFYGRLIDGGM